MLSVTFKPFMLSVMAPIAHLFRRSTVQIPRTYTEREKVAKKRLRIIVAILVDVLGSSAVGGLSRGR
jgi:hypothetical protein